MLVRLTIAGSVDDGKSTLIGRLLHDSGAVTPDQWDAVRQASLGRGNEEMDFSLLTDGLQAEREQRITIDVAHRYFSTPRRKFILADTPGHLQYTRNMVTGASKADLAILLVDARKGLTEQTRRHALIFSLFGVSHLVLAVNKMDLVDYSPEVFQALCHEFEGFARRLEFSSVTYLPLSALQGENVVRKRENLSWYSGPTLLEHLETVTLPRTANVVDFRFPVQYVIRPDQDFRGFAGRVVSGRIRAGQSVVVLPSERRTQVREVLDADGPLEEAFAGDSVVLTLEDETDVSRGAMLVRSENLPLKALALDCMVCWLGQEALEMGREYLMMVGARTYRCAASRLNYRLDVQTSGRESARTLHQNDLGRLQLIATEPVYFDPYRINRATGSFLLVAPDSNATVAAGMFRGETPSLNATDSPSETSIPNRPFQADKHEGAVVWFTGLSGSGKSTLAKALQDALRETGVATLVIDGDTLRSGLSADLGFSPEDRSENLRRAASVAGLAASQGQIAICSLISPYRADRELARSLFPPGRFLEVYLQCDLERLKQRDVKGLYARAESGELANFTGISAPYEEPLAPELVLRTDRLSVADGLAQILSLLHQRELLSGDDEA